ncbi:MAG: 5-dehydro-2-deoxygluconokinase [Alphaproteobacteria bacterium]|nr:5-dehydro-2-deoxygluconokinase [Alphaproteobacteria bacterium]
MLEPLRRNKFLILGRAGLDLYADPPGCHIEDALSFRAALGGSAANIAVAISRQGGACSLFGAVSDDAVGRFTLKALAGYGVDTRHVRTVGGEARNTLAVVETRNENCQSVIYRNGAADFEVTAADAAAIDYGALGAVIVTGTALAREPSRSANMKVLQLARQVGVAIVMDVDYRPYSWASQAEAQDVCGRAAALCDIIVGNDEEFAVLAGGEDSLAFAAQMAREAGRIAVHKMGGRGCVTFAGGQSIETPVFEVKALKPTGAGDGFMGGLMSGLAAGAPLPGALRRGAATAAMVVTRVGCAPAMPDADEVQAFLQQRMS